MRRPQAEGCNPVVGTGDAPSHPEIELAQFAPLMAARGPIYDYVGEGRRLHVRFHGRDPKEVHAAPVLRSAGRPFGGLHRKGSSA